MDLEFRVIPHMRASAAWNLALEEALFLKAREAMLKGKSFQPIVRLYSFNKPTVVLGNQQRISEIDFPYCQDQGVEVTMRRTGGGSVYLGHEDMQYGLILPTEYSKKLLTLVNRRLVKGIKSIGFSPQLVPNNGHDVIRMGGRGFVFDAQRRAFVYGSNGTEPKHVLLHHGTILIDNEDYDHMPAALKASPREFQQLQTGNVWLRNEAQIKEQELIRSLRKTLPYGTKMVTRTPTADEIRLAKKLHDEFYSRPEQWSGGKKKFGICYKTTTDEYDMEQYAETEKVRNGREVKAA